MDLFSVNKQKRIKQIERKIKDTKFPAQLVLEPTAACNLACIMCTHKSMERKKGNMEMTIYKKIIDEIAQNNKKAEVWLAFYGESLLLGYKLFYMIFYAKKQGLENVVLNTNAMLMDGETAEWLIDSGLDRLIISLDGFTKKTYEKIRVYGKYTQVKNNVENLLKITRKLNLKKPKVEVQFSVIEENEHEVEDFKNYWLARGAFVKIREKSSWGGSIEAKNLDPTLSRIACPWVKCCTILWNGDIAACPVDYDGKFIVGNVGDRSVKEIWQTKHKKLRQLHFRHYFDKLPLSCKRCLDWQTAGAKIFSPRTKKEVDWGKRFRVNHN